MTKKFLEKEQMRYPISESFIKSYFLILIIDNKFIYK